MTLYGHIPGGPYFDDLEVGQVFDSAPSMTLTAGVAAAHQAILGDRLRLPLDSHLSYAVTGATTALAHPGLVCDVAIGQSTLVTRHVKANLFYRGLVFLRFPVIGDSLFTRTEVVGLRQNTAKPGRTAGKATFSGTAFRVRISTPGSRDRYYAAAPTSSAALPSWPG